MLQDEERELLQPDHNNKDVKVINDLIDDLTRLECRDKAAGVTPMVMTRLHNNKMETRIQSSRPVTKQTTLMSSGSRGSAPDSVIIDTHSDSRVS